MSTATVLLLAAGEAWEGPALSALAAEPDLTVLKRCVDLPDLLASAATGQADVALVAGDGAGLDLDAVGLLRSHQVSAVAVSDTDADRLRRLGVADVVRTDLDGLSALLREAARADRWPAGAGATSGDDPGRGSTPEQPPDGSTPERAARVVAVWGPSGAPGRTTLAVGLAAELAARRHPTLLVDADPWTASVAQHLGVLDEASGLLSAARLANGGELEATRLAGVARSVAPGLAVLTGLPRPDRWHEVRPGVLTDVLDMAATGGSTFVVVDTGSALSEDGTGAGRNRMTLEALERADEIAVVGAADPVGLSRLARGLVELAALGTGAPVRAVVNRMRPSLGWSEKEITGMVEGFARPLTTTFLPEDRAGADRALMAGRALTEVGDSPLRRAIATVADRLEGERPRSVSDGRVRQRSRGAGAPGRRTRGRRGRGR